MQYDLVLCHCSSVPMKPMIGLSISTTINPLQFAWLEIIGLQIDTNDTKPDNKVPRYLLSDIIFLRSQITLGVFLDLSLLYLSFRMMSRRDLS